MIHISHEKEVVIDKNFLSVNGEKSCIVIGLGIIDHVKLEKKYDSHLNMRSNCNVIVLYNLSHQVLHRLLISDFDLSMNLFHTLSAIIKQREADDV